MIQNYSDLTRLEMEQVNKDETIVLIPLGALEQHGNQAPLGTQGVGSGRFRFSHADISGHPRRLEHGAQEFLRLHHI